MSNPMMTRKLIDYVADQGFNAIRIPVSWYYNTSRDDEGRLVINPDWLARVKEVVDYAMDNGMYTIIDSHHDSHFDKNVTLLFYTDVEDEEMSCVLADARTLWTQIAEYFKDYNEKLIFESFNDVNSKVTNSGFRYSQRAVRQMNELNQAFVSAIRATGGNNARRVHMRDILRRS